MYHFWVGQKHSEAELVSPLYLKYAWQPTIDLNIYDEIQICMDGNRIYKKKSKKKATQNKYILYPFSIAQLHFK